MGGINDTYGQQQKCRKVSFFYKDIKMHKTKKNPKKIKKKWDDK
jgi:hypothetical protein